MHFVFVKKKNGKNQACLQWAINVLIGYDKVHDLLLETVSEIFETNIKNLLQGEARPLPELAESREPST